MNYEDDGIDSTVPIKILLVEDDRVDQQAFRRFVAAKRLPYLLTVAGSVAEAVALLDGEFDLLVVDYDLGDGTALEVLALVKEAPVVVVTGAGNEEIAVDAMKAGAYDYLIKDQERNYFKVMPITIENAIRRFRAEKKMRRFYQELEKSVRERTEELAKTNSSLQEALVLAAAGTRARREFLANMTHELSTPLNSVIGFSQVLLDSIGGELTDKQRGYVRAILQSGERLNESFATILEVAALESGEHGQSIGRFPLRLFLQDALQAFKAKASQQGVALSLETEEPLVAEIEADRAKLFQAIFALLDNAIKFTPSGGRVTLSARRVANVGAEQEAHLPCPSGGEDQGLAQHGDFIEISIEDTGVGIREEDFTRLFKPFQQLESPYTKTYSGTGSGLFMAKKLIELHGGELKVASEFCKGTIFTFTLPVNSKNGSS